MRREARSGKWEAREVGGHRRVRRFPLPASRFPAVIALLAITGCSWFTDFKRQPKMDPWETPADTIAMRGNPQNSVSIYGSAAPGFAYGRAPTHGAVDSMAAIANPVVSDERSIRNGHILFSINCAVCHGDRGAGDGPIIKYGFPPIPIGAGSNAATKFTDGYIFGMMRNGRGLMPPYNRIEEHERWDVINYLRALQSGAATVAVGPVGRPGETGDLLPSASPTAPTRPAPYYRPMAATVPVQQPPGSQPPQTTPRPQAAVPKP